MKTKTIGGFCGEDDGDAVGSEASSWVIRLGIDDAVQANLKGWCILLAVVV